MKIYEDGKRGLLRALTLILLIIVSLLIHLIVFGTFLKYGFKNNAKRFVASISRCLRPAEKKSKLVAPKSNFGWVVFDTKQQQPENLDIQNSKHGNVGVAQSVHATETKRKTKPEPIKAELKAQHDDETIKPVDTKNINEQISTNQEKKTVEIVEQEDVEQQEMTKEEEKNMILSSILRKDVDEDKNVIEDKKGGKNIIKLTRGFIEKWDGESGKDLIDSDGDPNKHPDLEELKYISYGAKINWSLQASWKNNFKYSESLCWGRGIALKSDHLNATVEITIDENGKLLNTTMLQASGNREIDSAIMKNFEFASPFPPLPKHFGTKTLSIIFPVKVYMR